MPGKRPLAGVTWGSTVGKHAAPAGASVAPIVAEALAHRPDDAVHHAATAGSVGWPREPAPEGRVGWPGDLAGSAAPSAGPPMVRRSG